MEKFIEYKSIDELVIYAGKSGLKISELVMRDQAAQSERDEDSEYKRMERLYSVMEESVKDGCSKDIRSTSGLTGGDAYKMLCVHDNGTSLAGGLLPGALYRALAVAELNASMGRIVAAPTAGSCGILPAAVITMQQEKGIQRRECVMSLFTAAAVGMVIANNASLAGAQGGCQAECGSAAAMAAAALVELGGGTPEMVSNAVAIAVKNILGLVCDPVAGLVEIPCIKRNAAGVAGAFVAAELALAGIKSAIPADETIIAMKRVGDSMSASLKETAEGGLAATPTGQRIFEQVFGKSSADGGCGKGCSSCGACR